MNSDTASVSSRVVDVVARSKGVDPNALPPLYETIESDALDALFARSRDPGQWGERTDAPSVQFSYAGREVVVRSPDEIEVRRPASEGNGDAALAE